MRFTQKMLDERLRDGKIRSYTYKQGVSSSEGKTGAKIASKSKKGQKIKNWMDLNLWAWCRGNGYLLLTEQEFHEKRKWRFDWMVCGLKVAIEYNGIMSEKSRHTTITGYTGDMDKLNAAQAQGIKVLQFTPLNHKQLLTELEKLKIKEV